jgi:hypothetical protein
MGEPPPPAGEREASCRRLKARGLKGSTAGVGVLVDSLFGAVPHASKAIG